MPIECDATSSGGCFLELRQRSGPLLELADHQAVGHVLLLLLKIVGPEPPDAVHRHLLPVLILLDVDQDAGKLARRQESPETVEDLLEVLGLPHELLLSVVELLHQTVVALLLLLDGGLKRLQEAPLLLRHAHVPEHFLPPLLVLPVGLDGCCFEEVEVLARREYQELLALWNKGL